MKNAFMELTNMREITIGGDPEFWVLDSSGAPHGAFEFFPGTKENPYPLFGGSVQVDGFAVEVNIDPTSSVYEFDANIDRVMNQCLQFIPQSFSFDFSPVMKFDQDYFNDSPAVAKVIGCAPSIDVMTFESISPPTVATSNTRYAGGHIHMGYKGENFDLNCPVTRTIMRHKFSNMNSSGLRGIFDHRDLGSIDLIEHRISSYKLSSSVRLKRYGIEWRRPWSWWLDPENKSPRHHMFESIQVKGLAS